MYSFVRGTVLALEDGRISLLVENTGLGLEILPTALLFSNTGLGEIVEAHLHHHVTDVSEALFAFASAEEKRFFRKLLKVDGVGGKTALALLGLGIPSLVRAIETADEKVLSGVSGVGKKTALKVIVELKNEVSGSDIAGMSEPDARVAKPASKLDADTETVLASLAAMGYDRKAVLRVLEDPSMEGLDVREKTVAAIRSLAR